MIRITGMGRYEKASAVTVDWSIIRRIDELPCYGTVETFCFTVSNH